MSVEAGTNLAPAAPAAAAPAAGNQNTSAPATSDWTSALPEPAKLYVTQKGFKDPAAVLDSYQNLEKLMGTPKERLLRLPDKADAPEWGEIYDRLGRPKEASEYKFAAPEGSEANKEFTDWAQKQFHELGLTKAQGEKLAVKWNEYAMGDLKKQSETKAANLKTEDTALKREWGQAYEQKMKVCNLAAETFGLGKEEVTALENAIGYSKTLKFLDSIGSKLGEDSFVSGNAGGGFKGALTPEMARAEIAELRKDSDFVRRYSMGDREKVEQMTRLHKFAYPDLP